MADSKKNVMEASGEATEKSKLYQLAKNENPGAVIAQVKFDGDNYDEWAQAVRTALRVKKKYGFVDGSITKPEENDADYGDWVSANSMVALWILNTVDAKVRRTLANKEDPHELWKEIKDRFSEGNGPRIQEIKTELACLRQGGASVIDYFGRLTKLWDDLVNYEKTVTCTCGKCTCNLAVELEKKRDEDKIHQFLLGLDEEVYGAVRASIISTDPLPSINQVYSKVKSVERINTVMRGREEQSNKAAFNVRTGGVEKDFNMRTGNAAKEDKNKFCTVCKKTGHGADTCFQVIGYPEWWGERTRQTGRGGGRGGGRGRGVARAHAVQVIGGGESSTEAEKNGYTGLTNEQWNSLMQLLEKQKQNTTEPRLTGKIDYLEWVLDTGASNHMTGYRDNLSDLKYMLPCSVGLPNGKNSISREKGSVVFDGDFSLKNVLFVPDLRCNLISVSQLIADLDFVMQIANKGCVIQDRLTRNLIGAGELREGLYFFRRMSSFMAFKMNKDGAGDIWHRRLGHPSNAVFDLFPSVGSRVDDFSTCDVCLRSKQCRKAFPLSDNKSSEIFELIHVDLWGPYRKPSLCNSYYFLTIVDDFSRGVWVFLLHNKAQVGKTLRNFMAMVLRQFGKKIKIVRSDNGTEFTCLKSEFDKEGIVHQTSCVGTPQQNGRVERKHRHILNVARSLMFQSDLPIKFWGESILTAAHLINQTPSSVLKGKTPYEMIYGKPPTYDHLRIFGCLAFAHNQKRDGDKFNSRSRRCVFVGYPFGKKGWNLYDLDTQESFVSRDVIFVEDIFPLSNSVVSQTAESTRAADFAMFDDEEPELRTTTLTVEDVNIDSREQITETEHDEQVNSGILDQIVEGDSHESSDNIQSRTNVDEPAAEVDQRIDDREESNSEDEPEEEPEEERFGPGLREIKLPAKLKDYVLHTIHDNGDEEFLCTYPLSDFLNCDRFSQAHKAFLTAISNEVEPKTFREAVADKRWRNAMQLEVGALEENKTWDLEELPPGKKAIGSQWVFRIKFKADGTIERFKARLVALGNKQVAGVDYFETFAPVVKMTTVRTFLGVASAKDWELHQMDVHNAFLHGDLDEEVYMKPPPGFKTENPNLVCRLKKSLYGLKQSPRCWFAKLRGALLEYGFKQSYSDYSLFSITKGGIELYVLVYVDDLIIGGNNSAAITSFKEYLGTCFHMKDLGSLKYFLGIEVARRKEGIFLCQRKYALDIISEMGLLGAKPAATPIEEKHELTLSTSLLFEEPERYRRLVGRLIYLGATRPDLTYAVHILSKFMSEPRIDHWEAALRVVRYLKGTPGQGIFLRSDCDLKVYGWCDSDHGGCRITRKSLSGWFVTLGSSPISWKAKKQDVVSRSSAEAEYRAMSFTVDELKWLKALLVDLGVKQESPMSLACDNQAALYIAANPVFHERTKNIEIDCHNVRNAVQDKLISTRKVASAEQLADIFTKGLGRREFEYIRSKLGVCNPYAPT